MARHFRHLKTGELDGYTYVYYLLIFFVGGALVGMTEGKKAEALAFRLFACSMPAVLLEGILVWVSGRSVSATLMAISVALAIIGSLWINADREPALVSSPSQPQGKGGHQGGGGPDRKFSEL